MRRHFWMVGLVAVAVVGLWALPVRAEGDAPGDGDRLQRLERAVGDLARLVSRLTREVVALQKQNEQLLGELREARRDRGDREGRERDAKRGEGSGPPSGTSTRAVGILGIRTSGSRSRCWVRWRCSQSRRRPTWAASRASRTCSLASRCP